MASVSIELGRMEIQARVFESRRGYQGGPPYRAVAGAAGASRGGPSLSVPARSNAMRTLTCLALAGLLSGCLPIGIRGQNLPLTDASKLNPSAMTAPATR